MEVLQMHQENQQYLKIISFPKQVQKLTTASITKLKNGLPEEVLLDKHIITTKVVGVLNSEITWSLHDSVKVIVNYHRAVVYENIKLVSKKNHEMLSLNGDKLQFNLKENINIKCGDTQITIKSDGTLDVDVEKLCNLGIWCLSILGFKLAIL